jgi:hypothetical protein
MKPMQPGDIKSTYADIGALKDAVGFAPSTPLAAGLAAPYPPAWDPLPSRPQSSAVDCGRFQGTYVDWGEAPGQSGQPSLTRELFGQDSPWERATSLRLHLASDDVLEVTVTAADKPMTRQFSAKAGDLSCDGGPLVLRSRRWVASDLMSGRENVKIDLH